MKIHQIILAIIILIFDWIIDKFNQIGKWINFKLHLQKIETFLINCNRYTALVSILLGILIITPINVLATICLVKGLIFEFIILELFGKILTMIIIVRIFNLTKDRLLTFELIKSGYDLYNTILKYAKEIIYKFKQTEIYQRFLKYKELFTTFMTVSKQYLRTLWKYF